MLEQLNTFVLKHVLSEFEIEKIIGQIIGISEPCDQKGNRVSMND